MKTRNTTRRQTAQGRSARAMRRRMLPLLIAGCFGQAAWANPLGAQVVSGQVGFQQQGGLLSVTNSPGAIINWQSFSISPGETTRFIQQNAASAVLNRVVGQDPSQILGAFQSNGRVFLVNPNGILFGQGARIDVNGLVASTLNIGNEDFINGKLQFKSAGTAGDIVNQGTIRTPQGGQVYLVAPNVENSGIIHSPKGEVLLAAGHTVHLVDSSNPNLQVVLSAPESAAVNLGQIVTEGGRTGIYGALIRQRGIVSADSAVVGENGKIVFKASKDALLEAGSVTSATGAGKGGEIQVLAERVGLTGNAKIDASGQTGGGTVLVGGDYLGANPEVQNAKRTFMSRDAVIRADAGASGDGGKVIVWSDEATRVHGTISARGGLAGGDGGFVETSGKYLDVDGIRVDARAPLGKTGDWLLDPDYIYVTSTGSATLDDVDDFSDPGSISTISAATISGATASVRLQATQDINFNSAISIGAANIGLSAQAGNNINVNADIVTNGGRIDLHAAYPYSASTSTSTSASTSTGTSASTSTSTSTGAVNLSAILRSNGGNIDLAGAAINFGSSGVADVGTGDLHATVSQANGVLSLAPGATIIGTGDSRINLLADNIHLGGQIQAGGALGGATVNIMPYTSSHSIDLGTKTSGKLGLTAAELANISTHDLNIRNVGTGGSISVTAATNFSADRVKNLSLSSEGGIQVNAPLSVAADLGTIGLDTYTSSSIAIGTAGAVIASGANSDVELYAPGGNVTNAGTIQGGYVGIYSSGKFSQGPGGTIAATEEVSLHADKMSLGGSISTSSSSGEVVLYTSKKAELGSTDNSDSSTEALQLGSGELNAINTGTLHIYGLNGIHVKTAIAPSQLGHALSLYTNGGITQDSGATIGARALAMYADSVDLRESNGTGVIAAAVKGDFAYRSRNLLTVSNVAGFGGIFRYGKTPGTIFLQSDSALGINQSDGASIYTNGGTLALRTPGAVRLGSSYNVIDKLAATAGSGGLEVFSAGDMQIVASAMVGNGINTGNGEVVLRTGHNALLSIDQQINAGTAEVDLIADRLALNADITASEASIRPYTSGRAITVGQAACVQEECLSVTNLHRIAAHTIGIGREPTEPGTADVASATGGEYTPVGAIHVAGITAGSGGAQSDRHSLTTRIGLLSSEGVTQSGAIEVSELGVLAGGDVLLTHAGNRVSTLIGKSEEGNFTFVNVGQLNIGTIAGPDYAYHGIRADHGSISVSNTGHLRVGSGASVTTGDGGISLVAHSPLTIDGNVTSTSGAITLEASPSGSADDVLTVNGTVSSGGAIDLRAGAGIVVNGSVHGSNISRTGGLNQVSPTSPAVLAALSAVVNNTVQATQAVTAAVNSTTADASAEKEERKEDKTAAAAKDEGAKKNESGKKLYCN